MLNLITITSIKTTNSDSENNLRNDEQRPPLINYNTDFITDDQKDGYIQFIPNNSRANKKISHFLIKTQDKKYKHTFRGVGEWVSFDRTQYFVNQPDYDVREYLYNPVNNKIHNKFVIRSLKGEYQPFKIKMVYNLNAKAQILVNDLRTHNFDLKCIGRDQSVLFLTLVKHEQKVCVSSIILFFKYQMKIYCSIQQMVPVLPLESIEDIIQQNWQGFIDDFVLKVFEVSPKHTVRQLEMILENMDCFGELLKLKDAANFENDKSTTNVILDQKPILYVNKYNIYDKKYWEQMSQETCRRADTYSLIYSLNDKMISKYEYYSNETRKELTLKWRIISHKILKAFKILNLEFDECVYGKVIGKRVFTIYPFCSNQQTTNKKINYVFFRCFKAKKTLFCVKYVDDVFQIVKDCDIHEIVFILKTTNVFYSLTHKSNKIFATSSLLSIMEESEASSDIEDSSSSDSEYETEENVLNSTDEEIISFNEEKNTLENNLIAQTQEEEIDEASNLLEDDLIVPTLVNEINEVNNQLKNEINTIKEGKGLFNDLTDDLKVNSSNEESQNKVKNKSGKRKNKKSISSRNRVRNFFRSITSYIRRS